MQDIRTEEFFEDFALGRLDPKLADTFARHMHHCQECRHRLESVESYIFALRNALMLLETEAR